MKTISLTQDQSAIVNDEDFEWLNEFKWCAGWNEKTESFYALRSECIQGTKGAKKKTIRMHRLIMNAQPDNIIDHINHDTLDNRRENLRLVTGFQNAFNMKRHKKAISNFKGTWWWPQNKKCGSHIRINKKLIHLGYFDTEEEAAHAYDDTAYAYDPEHCFLNFPEDKRNR